MKRAHVVMLLILVLFSPCAHGACGPRIIKAAKIGVASLVTAGALSYTGGLMWANGWFNGTPQPRLEVAVKAQRAGKLPAKITVEHVTQQHYNPVEIDREEVLTSQLKIARIILAGVKAGKSIFVEGMFHPVTAEHYRTLDAKIPFGKEISDLEFSELKNYIREQKLSPDVLQAFLQVRHFFPRHFPNDPKELSEDAESVLIVNGAGLTLWALGDVPELLPAASADPKILERQHQAFMSLASLRGHLWIPAVREVTTRLWEEREIIALINIISYFDQHPERLRDAILVFGGGHKFTAYNSPWLEVVRQ